MQILCKRAQREFTLNLPSTAKYYANLYKKSELYASFIKKLRPQPYIASRLFMLYAFFQ